MRKLLVYASILLSFWILSSCGTSQKTVVKDNGERHQQTDSFSRVLSYTVEADSREGTQIQGQTFALKIDSAADSLKIQREARWIKRALVQAGMKEAASLESAAYQVQASFELKDPIGGLTLGIINPYNHTLVLKAYRGKELDWEIKSTGPSEYKERRETAARLLAASMSYFGKTTPEPVRERLGDHDSKVLQILQEPAQSP